MKNKDYIDTETSDIITLPIKVESRNKLDRQHWAVKRKAKQTYQLFIRNQMRLQKIKAAKQKKYKLVILSYRKKKLDYDNLVGGCKHLIDALIEEGFIFDDNPDYIDLNIAQYIAKEYQTIIIRKS